MILSRRFGKAVRRGRRTDPMSSDPRTTGPEAFVIPLRQKEKRAVTVARAILHGIHDERASPPAPACPRDHHVDRYQVARSTFREALRILEVQGLISIKFGPDGGPVVRRPTPRDFSHVLTSVPAGPRRDAARPVRRPPLRRAVHGGAGAPGAVIVGPGADLRAVLARTADAVEWPDFVDAMASFHTRVLSMSGDPVLDLWAVTLQTNGRLPHRRPVLRRVAGHDPPRAPRHRPGHPRPRRGHRLRPDGRPHG